jgi:DNA-binding PucR family transcriptional regulator
MITYERSTLMSSEKYIGLDVHQATISVAVMDSQGKVMVESILETQASTILEFLAGLRGSLFVTFEEGTWAAWLYDLLKPHGSEVLGYRDYTEAKCPMGTSVQHASKEAEFWWRALAWFHLSCILIE